ncbi:MAG: trypsin-like peptidase domain-containing protein [Gemmatimonadota bacterium]
MADAAQPDRAARAAAVFVHLTGRQRGTRQHVAGAEVRIGTAADADLHFPPSDAPSVAPHHATLIRQGDGCRLIAGPGRAVFVNGEAAEGPRRLEPGDVIQLGESGPVLRFRLEAEPPGPYKTMRQTVADCLDCARYPATGLSGRIGRVIGGLPRELLTHTRPRVRVATLGVLLLLLGAVGSLGAFALRLERRVDAERRRVSDIEQAVRDIPTDAVAGTRLESELSDIRSGLTERIEALEALSEAGRRVVAGAAGSVIFLQGGVTFRDPQTDEPLRFALGPDGRPRMGVGGVPVTLLGGDGPVFESRYTGSGFLVSDRGLVVTNRHVARPWDFDRGLRIFVERGYRPELRLLGYAPGIAKPFALRVSALSASSDLAVVRSTALGRVGSPLPLREASPSPGEEILVLGYPAGIDAVLARSSAPFADSLVRSGADFWAIARRLSDVGLVRPLASRGIVGQVTPSSVVYDAETTRGGSGGPVLGLDGRVVAVTVAVMTDFGGSNLGVPVEEVRKLLGEVAGGGARAP